MILHLPESISARISNIFCFSELLRMVLFVLDEGVAHLETYVEFPGKEALQRSCLSALQARITIIALKIVNR